MVITKIRRKATNRWSAPLGILAGMAVGTLFRGHLDAEYFFIVGSLSTSALALTVFAVRQTSKNQQHERLEFEEKLRQRRRTNFLQHNI